MTSPSQFSRLQPSRLSNQLELLKDDVDLSSLNLAVQDAASFHLLESITGASMSRTIEGASTITLTVNDRDGTILKSGILGDSLTLSRNEKTVLGVGVAFERPIDIKIDGLWFRLVNFTQPEPTSRVLTLQFEDREVSLLRSYPRKGTAGYREKLVVPATAMTRARFMQMLVQEVKELNIRLVCPMLGDAPSLSQSQDAASIAAARTAMRKPGFPPFPDITVKGLPSTQTQIANLEAVLDEGERQKAPQKVLVTAVMVVTQESSALTSATNGIHVGLFQQDPNFWPATRDPTTDAKAFFERILLNYAITPNTDDAQLGESVQHSGQPELYAQWRSEAEHTVDLYLGTDDPTSPGSPYVIPTGALPDIKGSFTRGSAVIENGKTVFVRENNWVCLQRNGAAVGWRVFCVSGTIYIVTDQHLFNSKVLFVAEEDTPGIDGIGFQIDTGKANAQVSVACRAGRWQAPPGSVSQVKGKGPVDGRWLVTQIDRASLFDPATIVTMKKPQPALPDAESADPVQASGQNLYNADGTPDNNTPSPTTTSTVRDGLVAIAQKAIVKRSTFLWALEPRPMPSSLWLGTPTSPERIDCSTFVTLVYKAGGAPDPNNFNYNGTGDTTTLVRAGTNTTNPQRGDLAFYGPSWANTEHVALYIGNGKIISLGGPAGVIELDVKYRNDFLGYLTYPLGVANNEVTQVTAVGP